MSSWFQIKFASIIYVTNILIKPIEPLNQKIETFYSEHNLQILIQQCVFLLGQCCFWVSVTKFYYLDQYNCITLCCIRVLPHWVLRTTASGQFPLYIVACLWGLVSIASIASRHNSLLAPPPPPPSRSLVTHTLQATI